jgi:hypothetical protein
MGVINTKKSLVECGKLSASTFCRRRIGVVMVRLKFCSTVREAVALIEQGHIRVGPNVVTDPAFLVSRYGGRRIGQQTLACNARARALSLSLMMLWVLITGLWRISLRGRIIVESSDMCSSITTSSMIMTCCKTVERQCANKRARHRELYISTTRA